MFPGFRVSIVGLALAGLTAVPAAAQGPDDDLSGKAHALRQIISTMETEAAELRPRLDDARTRLAETTRQAEEAGATLAEAQAALADLRRTEAAVRASIAQGRAEQARQDAAAKAAAGELAQVTARIQAARATLARMTEQQAALQADLDRAGQLSRQIEDRQARADELAGRVRDLTAELAGLERDRKAAMERPPVDAAPAAAIVPEAGQAPARTRRDPARVDAALAAAPALPDGDGHARLRDLLVSGECATQALRQVQDPINRQTLLVLVDRLGGC